MTEQQATTIREMAMAEKPNADIIKATGLPATEVYAFRSKHGITRDKVKAILEENGTVGQIKCGIVLMQKMDFVNNHLAPLLKAIDETITKVEYSVRADQTETVIIHFACSGRRIINVTADSLAALARDVLRGIEW